MTLQFHTEKGREGPLDHPRAKFAETILRQTHSGCQGNLILTWLVVWTPLKNISQLGWLFPIYGKIKNVPNHQPVTSGIFRDPWGWFDFSTMFLDTSEVVEVRTSASGSICFFGNHMDQSQRNGLFHSPRYLFVSPVVRNTSETEWLGKNNVQHIGLSDNRVPSNPLLDMHFPISKLPFRDIHKFKTNRNVCRVDHSDMRLGLAYSMSAKQRKRRHTLA